MRIGELLVAAGLLSVEQAQQALRAQVMWGGRFGTNAIELGFIEDLDELTRVIARQRHLPAAFMQHFAGADPELQRMLPPELAEEHACIPLQRVGTDRVVVASIAPLPGRARAYIADALGISHRGLIPSIAPELRIHYYLERVYDIPRPVRFLRSRKRSTMPTFEIDVLAYEDSEPHEIPLPIEAEEPSAPALSDTIEAAEAIPEELPDFAPVTKIEVPEDERRHYVTTLNDDAPAIARIKIQRVATPATGKPLTLADATRALRRSPDRAAIARSLVDALRFTPARAAVLLVVRGGEAIGWVGYRADGAPLPDIAVPLDQPGLVPTVIRDKANARGALLGKIDTRLLAALGANGDLVVAPIAIGEHVWCVIVIATEHGASVEGLDAITTAASIAFARLLRMADR